MTVLAPFQAHEHGRPHGIVRHVNEADDELGQIGEQDGGKKTGCAVSMSEDDGEQHECGVDGVETGRCKD